MCSNAADAHWFRSPTSSPRSSGTRRWPTSATAAACVSPSTSERQTRNSCRLPPVSLAELFQNALKHNTAGPDLHLNIRVRVDDATLLFENDLRPGPKAARSTGIGLANLRERFRIATGRPAEWIAEEDRFVVRLPLVRNGSQPSPP